MSPVRTAAAAAIDPGTAQAIAGASAAGSLIAVLQEWALALLGVPLGVPLAGFAGACYGASYREPRTAPAFWRSVLLTTAMASIFSPLAAHGLKVEDLRYAAPVAALLGWLLEWGAPWLKANGGRMASDAWAKFFPRPAPPPEPPTLPPDAPRPRGTPGDEA